jgi:hypothetical protein
MATPKGFRNIFSQLKGQAIQDGIGYYLRQRVLVADVNAGLVLLAPQPNLIYRLQDVALIAIGGAASGATDVRILATQSAASAALLIAAIAGLTQNTLLRAGAANAAILAAGASFIRNDVNTGISIGKTGGALATATAIDVLMEFTVEQV